MKLVNKLELWRITSGANFTVEVKENDTHWWIGGQPKQYDATDWATAEARARAELDRLHPGKAPTLYVRRWKWEQHLPGESRYQEVSWRDWNGQDALGNFVPGTPVSWWVRRDCGRGDLASSSHSANGSVALWEQGIEKGREALVAMLAVPFPLV